MVGVRHSENTHALVFTTADGREFVARVGGLCSGSAEDRYPVA